MAQIKNINIVPGGTTPVINVSQNDVGREIIVNVTDGTEPYDLTGKTVKLAGTKPSGLGYSVTGTASEHQVTFVTTKQMTGEFGNIMSDIKIISGSTEIGTANVILAVEKDPHPDETTDGDADTIVPEITVLVERVEAAVESLHELTVEAETLDAGHDATVEYDDENNKFTFGIPKGYDGYTIEGSLSFTDQNAEGNVVISIT